MRGPGFSPGLVSSATAARTRGVAAKHASLSRWRSPVRIRSGPPVPTQVVGFGRAVRSPGGRRGTFRRANPTGRLPLGPPVLSVITLWDRLPIGTGPPAAKFKRMALTAVLGLTVLLAASLTGCQQPGTITTGQDGLRTFATNPNVICNLSALLHPFSGVLEGDLNAPERIWLEQVVLRSGRVSVVWPQGFHVRFEPDAVLYNEKDVPVARDGETVSFAQVKTSEHAGTYDDPYLAHGLIFGRCYPA